MTEKSLSKVKLRFPPSPTGHWHLGGARSALFNWLFAKKHGGEIVLRSEDTDKSRSDKKYEIEIVETMRWLGLDWSEGIDWEKDGDSWKALDRGPHAPYRQSERTEIYEKYLSKLLEDKKAYYCYCSKEDLEAEKEFLTASGLPPKYSGKCRNLKEAPEGKIPQSIRFRTPDKKISFEDLVRGNVSFDTSLFGDMIIAKDTKNPLYNFAVVVDDYEMEVTHVIRGEEHLANTPRQMLIQEALGFNTPTYGHLPLILAADRSKLSKRYAETAMLQYKEDGYLPEALINFLVLLGWHPSGNDEIFSLEELIKEFDVKRVQKAGAVFDPQKLDWLNGYYIRKMSPENLAERLKDFTNTETLKDDRTLKIISAVRDRMTTLKDFGTLSSFFHQLPAYEADLLVWKKSDKDKTKEVLEGLLNVLGDLPESGLNKEILDAKLETLIQKFDKGTVLWPMRVALSGQSASPDPFTIAEILGREEVLKRISLAHQKLNG